MKLWKTIRATWNVSREMFSAWCFLVKLNFGTYFYDTFIDPGHSDHYIDFELRLWEEQQREKEIKTEIDDMISAAEKGK